MASHMSEEEIYKVARKRVEEKKGFFVHLAVYIVVNIIIILTWAFAAGGGFAWFLFPLCGWGIGIIFHGLGVFVFNRQTGWEQREIEKEAERIRKSRQ